MSIKTLLSLAIASVLLTVLVDSHSWADCVDWRFNNPNKPGWRDSDGKCFGWARQYPVNSGVPFAYLDSASPSRHYQQDPKDFTPCSDTTHGIEPGSDERRQNPISRAYGGRWGTMASAKAGEKICVRWPAQQHAVEDEPDRGVFINMPPTPTTRDPSQSQLMKMTIAKLPYKNCNNTGIIKTNPCGGCFTIPADRKTGAYLVQWRWELNDNEWYTSCWDLQVAGKDTNSNPALPGTEPPAQPEEIVEPSVELPSQPGIEPPSQPEDPIIAPPAPPAQPEEPTTTPPAQPEEPTTTPPAQPEEPITTPPARPEEPVTEPPPQFCRPITAPPAQPGTEHPPPPQPSQPGEPSEPGKPNEPGEPNVDFSGQPSIEPSIQPGGPHEDEPGPLIEPSGPGLPGIEFPDQPEEQDTELIGRPGEHDTELIGLPDLSETEPPARPDELGEPSFTIPGQPIELTGLLGVESND